jgi:hypothetical protein
MPVTDQRRTRLLLSPLLLLVALLTTIGLHTSSAAASAGPETRVRANEHPAAISVEETSSESPASVGCLRPSQPVSVSGSCVATESGVRLRPGTVQPGVERTYDMALNPQEYIDATVKQYGINLRGSGQRIEAVYNPDLVSAGMSRAATPNVIEIGPLGMSSPEELARTLSHELNHARSFLAGGIAPESSAYAAEDSLSAWLAGHR